MTQDRIAAQDRVAPASDHVLTGPVTLMNSFAVRPDRDEAFHGTDEFRRVVTQPGWEEFPSSPMLYQVMTETG